MTQIVTPYPNYPHNDTDNFDADPIRAQFTALIQYLQAFPGDNVIAKSLVEAAFADAINPRLRASETFADFVVTGGLSGGFSGLSYTVPTGTAYTGGYRHTITATSFTATVSRDTYVYVSNTGNVAVVETANNAGTPSLPASSQWLQKVVTSGTAITAITDLRNLSPVKALSIGASKLTGVKLYGATPLVGTITDLPNTTFLVQEGSVVLPSTYSTFTFPSAFPNGVVNVQVTNGDFNANSGQVVAINATLSTVQIGSTGSGAFRANYRAIGW